MDLCVDDHIEGETTTWIGLLGAASRRVRMPAR
jgi:hypothetical protein